ncbi:hypothetical protein [Arcicella rosea]|uniref:Uncharacterized protein n=1 Tax=Arcicella rosea TaxID=502909 RepID=A0A841ELI4_9BACT|nr:hypothetical protein [Arcicella rosea]MBB6003796.1 hypothetical protein [Arcicella rosea]
MFEKKDYTQLTLEELLIEEKKMKKNESFTPVSIGILVGTMLYGLLKNGSGFFFISILIILIGGIYQNSKIQKQNLKDIQAEINNKNGEKDK